ncbi:MAG: sulfite exporter TauE/SafE family protein [Alphaproteobacteria bacterium]
MTPPGDAWAALISLVELCRDGLVQGYGPVAGLFLAGLAGGFAHCAGMCGPFVLGQAAAGGAPRPSGRTRRLLAAALLPYHLGRATTYALLGAVVAGGAGLVARFADVAWLAVPLLLAAAALISAQAFGVAVPSRRRAGPLAALARIAAGLAPGLGRRGSGGRYALGVLLGFLPCGLLYAALAGAAATAHAGLGAAAMVAFAAGTAPALMLVGFAGHGLARRAGAALRVVAVVLLIVNAATLGVVALAATP